MGYFLRMVELYAQKVCALAVSSASGALATSLSHLKPREKESYGHLAADGVVEFTSIDMAREFGVSNSTIINWSVELAANVLLVPNLAKERFRSYKVILPGTESANSD